MGDSFIHFSTPRVEVSQYYQVSFDEEHLNPEQWKYEQQQQKLKELLEQSAQRRLIADMHAYLVLHNDILIRIDCMSMAHGLEVWEPFPDHEVVRYHFTGCSIKVKRCRFLSTPLYYSKNSLS